MLFGGKIDIGLIFQSGGENNGISLQLRPTLPRKQLDIPRFSPTAAWRLLSALESPVQSEEDDLVMLEERIPLPAPLHHHEKSGDSGISGDASPHSTHNSQVKKHHLYTLFFFDDTKATSFF